VTEGPSRVPQRGSALLYAIAFTLLVAAVVPLVMAAIGFLESTGLLLLSAALSGLALIVAIAGILVPRRR
jgi:hypothetical protein